MKKFILAIFITIILTGSGYSQVALSSKDSLTSLQDTDLMLWQRKVTGSFLNKKMSYNYLKLTLKDYLDGQAITWAARQTFAGATFGAASYGTVTFGDSVWHASGAHYVNRVYPTTSATSQIGTLPNPYQTIYVREVKLINSGGTDSASVTISSTGEVSVTNLAVTETMSMDSAAALQALKLEPETYTIADVNDTVITTATLMSNMQLILPGDVARGIETINMDGAASGHILIIYTTDADDSVLIDQESDGNLNLATAGDYWLRSGDNIAFMYMYDQPALTWYWMELWRKNN